MCFYRCKNTKKKISKVKKCKKNEKIQGNNLIKIKKIQGYFLRFKFCVGHGPIAGQFNKHRPTGQKQFLCDIFLKNLLFKVNLIKILLSLQRKKQF